MDPLSSPAIPIACAILVVACHAPAVDPREIACVPQGIVDGSPADDPALSAVGTLGVLESGRYHAFCTAVLVAPDVVLTAKHCVFDAAGAPPSPGTVFFGIGFDADRPERVIEVTGATASTPNGGGVAGVGSDVAACVLREPATGVVPIGISRTSAAGLVGTAVTVVGYGTDLSGCAGATPFRPLRRAGVETVRASQGNVFELVFGGRAEFVAHAPPDWPLAELDRRYDSGVLLEGYEVWASSWPGEVQTCHGDSGGPALVEQDGNTEVVGLTSWSWRSASRACDDGTVFAVFGDETWTMLSNVL